MKKSLLTGAVCLTLLLVGCGKQDSSSSSSSSSSEQVKITAVGSTALQPLVEAAKDQFQEKNANYQISVQGGGSGTGLSQVSDKAVDIGNSDLFAEEKEGVPSEKLVDHKVAVVGMGPVINKDAGVTKLTMEQLKNIFTGKVTNWKEVGGKDQKITVINRAAGSGTRATFEKWVLDGADAVKSQEQDSSGTVKQIVTSTPGAVSYLAFSYFDSSLVAPSIDGVKPTEANVADNSWKIWAYEHMYTNGKPSASVKKFLDFMVSDDVQKSVVKKLGYLPITSMKVERDAKGTVKDIK